jgi:hypothetical protein
MNFNSIRKIDLTKRKKLRGENRVKRQFQVRCRDDVYLIARDMKKQVKELPHNVH